MLVGAAAPCAALCAALPAGAQPRPDRVDGLPSIGSPADEWTRVRQTLGLDSTAGYLMRTASTLGASLDAPRAADGARVRVLLPEVASVWSSRLPERVNLGQLWAARGASASVRGGARLTLGRLELIAAPELTHAQNLGFPIFPGRAAGRSVFASPWHTGAASADLPLRFGDAPLTQLGLGQSSATLGLGRAAIGVSGETQWWGPGVRNALLLSDNAEGVPHAFVRTARPLRTALGDVEARLIVGGLTPSIFFDTVRTGGLRSLSGAVATLRVRGEPGLTLGIERLVLAPVASRGRIAARVGDVLRRWNSPTVGDDDPRPDSDQLTGIFARWVFPSAGFEVYGEWARSALPRSFRELLAAPQHSQAYTLGVAQATRFGARAVLRVEFEATSLEQSRALTDRPPVDDYYTTRSAPQGFTQRGRVLGAAVGPGGSGQWLAAHLFVGPWQAGLYAERIRHENDALYDQFLTNLFRHDVSVIGGARVVRRLPAADVRVEASISDRLNYLFQNGSANFARLRTVDLHNVTLSLEISPRRGAVRPPTVSRR